jgi:hypothetical protein
VRCDLRVCVKRLDARESLIRVERIRIGVECLARTRVHIRTHAEHTARSIITVRTAHRYSHMRRHSYLHSVPSLARVRRTLDMAQSECDGGVSKRL